MTAASEVSRDRPWESEPDRFEADFGGLKILVLRNTAPGFGHLCGYVGIPEGHELYERFAGSDYSDLDFQVHGGLTFGGSGGDRFPSGYFFLGFDCAHLGDFQPFLPDFLRRLDLPYQPFCGASVYRDLDYVLTECVRLALQILGEEVPEDLELEIVEEGEEVEG